ncbi:MAG: hypothetical protein ACREFC_09635 [Stellaceae bacterium]
MIRVVIPAVFFLLGTAAAHAGMDYRCLAACEQAGYARAHCLPRCATETPNQSANPAMPNTHGTDYRCVDKCAGTGRPRNYCLKNCAY